MKLLGDAGDATTSEVVGIIGAIGGLLAAFYAFLKWLMPFIDRARQRRRTEIRKELKAREQSLAKVATDGYRVNMEALDELRRGTEGERAVLIRLHNCGGPLDAVRFTQSSAELESTSDEAKKIAPSWRNEHVDLHYSQVVGSLLNDDAPDWIELIRDELPESSILRRLYTRFGVARSVKWYVGGRKNAHYLIALHLGQNQPASFETLDRLREASNVVRGQLDRYEQAQALVEDTEKELEKV